LDGIDALIGCSGAVVEVLSPPVIAKSCDSESAANYRQIYKDTLSTDIVHACIDIAREWNIYVSFGGNERIFARFKGPVEPGIEDSPVFSFLEEEELLQALGHEPVSCGFIFMEPGVPESAVLEAPALSDATAHRSGEGSFIITNRGVDKGTGLLILAEHFGVPREAILAIGNDENDIPMLEAAGVGVAVANASPRTLAAADWIAPDVRHAGAAEAIRRFTLPLNSGFRNTP
jgi:hydroxymethylpyrimidine pyrophosphatase-like HAD family hydrolase